ncbi:DNA polymerase III, delta subunit [Moorella thermoacetica Y72]|uniref:DNA polymerase III subunit delta n=1 Tax=Moorella thermoacetica Y72 TaxID=1325331 RepID=A0A0S6UFY9_NEOTH|nr:DNA polymerase III subunit delta [Moorella thermoacetica]GAF26304.1 DNA polymerase III, delta subunit [Moorella thermoacetica Y72]
MDWQAMVEEVEQGYIAPVYLFYGSEGYLKERALKILKKKLIPPETGDFDYQELDGRELTGAEVIMLAATLPAMAERRLVVIKDPAGEIWQDEDFLKYLTKLEPATCLVLVVNGSIDKRLKAVKEINSTGRVVECSPLQGEDLAAWLIKEARQEGYNLPPATALILARAGGGDLRQARNELDKAMAYTGKPGTITPATVQALIPEIEAENTIFQLVDALGNRKPELAIGFLRQLLERGEAPLGIVAMLARQLRLIYRAHLGGDKRNLAARLGVKPFVARKVAAQARNFSLPVAGQALEELLKVDTALKTGQGEAGPLLEQAIWTIIAMGEH